MLEPQSLHNNKRNIISKFNQQISLTNHHLIDNFNKTITLLTNNQKIITKEVEKLNMILDDLIFESDKFIQNSNTEYPKSTKSVFTINYTVIN